MKFQAYFSALKRQPFPILLCIGLVVWLFLLIQPLLTVEPSMSARVMLNMPMETHSHHHMYVHASPNNQLWSAIMQTTSLHWFLMLIAMMLPLLSDAVLYIWRKNFPRKRYSSLAAFFTGYIGLWSFIGIVLFFLTEQLSKILDYKYNLTVIFLILLMMLWQATPWKQRSLNRCHIAPRINPFGIQAEISSFNYGIKKAFYCVGTCWVLMWISLFTMQKTMYFMPIFSLMMYVEQALPWQPERWKVPYTKLLWMKVLKPNELKVILINKS